MAGDRLSWASWFRAVSMLAMVGLSAPALAGCYVNSGTSTRLIMEHEDRGREIAFVRGGRLHLEAAEVTQQRDLFGSDEDTGRTNLRKRFQAVIDLETREVGTSINSPRTAEPRTKKVRSPPVEQFEMVGDDGLYAEVVNGSDVRIERDGVDLYEWSAPAPNSGHTFRGTTSLSPFAGPWIAWSNRRNRYAFNTETSTFTEFGSGYLEFYDDAQVLFVRKEALQPSMRSGGGITLSVRHVTNNTVAVGGQRMWLLGRWRLGTLQVVDLETGERNELTLPAALEPGVSHWGSVIYSEVLAAPVVIAPLAKPRVVYCVLAFEKRRWDCFQFDLPVFPNKTTAQPITEDTGAAIETTDERI